MINWQRIAGKYVGEVIGGLVISPVKLVKWLSNPEFSLAVYPTTRNS